MHNTSDSKYFDSFSVKTKNKFNNIKKMILSEYPEIASIKIYINLIENDARNSVRFEMTFEIESKYECIDHIRIIVSSHRSLTSARVTTIFRLFKNEYEKYRTIDFNNLTCKYCKNLIKSGDFNLACSEKHNPCYEDRPACDLFSLNSKFAAMSQT